MKRRGVQPRQSGYQSKYIYSVLLVVIVALLGFVLLNNLIGWEAITGALTSGTTTASVVINNVPVTYWILAPTAQSITESGTTAVKFSFNVSDADGSDTINNASARLSVNYTSGVTGRSTTRTNTSCFANQTVANTTKFECIILMWYFDDAADWTINASANDTSGILAFNMSANFTLQSTTAMVMSPTALTWPSLELGTSNQTSNADPVTVNNTGNKVVNTSGITVTGYSLQGLTTTTQFILAQNFSVWHTNGSSSCTEVSCLECNGTQLLNATAEALPYANVSIGNNSQNYQNATSGQVNLFFCLRTVATEISRQTYNTAGINTASWTVTVS